MKYTYQILYIVIIILKYLLQKSVNDIFLTYVKSFISFNDMLAVLNYVI